MTPGTQFPKGKAKMKTLTPVLAIALLAACSAPAPSGNPAASDAPPATAAPAPVTDQAPASVPPVNQATRATGSGTIEAIDSEARTITIAHGPVEALQWPAMTMTFRAPDVDLGSLEKGDRVEFDLAASGMEGTIVRISKR